MGAATVLLQEGMRSLEKSRLGGVEGDPIIKTSSFFRLVVRVCAERGRLMLLRAYCWGCRVA